jgi:RHS repeat-associated protein
VATYRYNAFGRLINTTGTLDQPYQFSTKRYDAGTGLNYYGYRFYAPVIERWLNRDPLGEAGGINLYGFVGNDPVNYWDFNGLTKIDVDIGNGTMTVDPEKDGQPPYQMPITSGRGECTNDPECSDKEDTGPIPPGDYNANAGDLTDPGFVGDVARNARGDWGDWRVPAKPSPGTNTRGRSGFFLHGGRFSGSAGCIDFGGGGFGNDATDKLKRDILNDPDGVVPIKVH